MSNRLATHLDQIIEDEFYGYSSSSIRDLHDYYLPKDTVYYYLCIFSSHRDNIKDVECLITKENALDLFRILADGPICSYRDTILELTEEDVRNIIYGILIYFPSDSLLAILYQEFLVFEDHQSMIQNILAHIQFDIDYLIRRVPSHRIKDLISAYVENDNDIPVETSLKILRELEIFQLTDCVNLVITYTDELNKIVSLIVIHNLLPFVLSNTEQLDHLLLDLFRNAFRYKKEDSMNLILNKDPNIEAYYLYCLIELDAVYHPERYLYFLHHGLELDKAISIAQGNQKEKLVDYLKHHSRVHRAPE